jgi:hypothetical protein
MSLFWKNVPLAFIFRENNVPHFAEYKNNNYTNSKLFITQYIILRYYFTKYIIFNNANIMSPYCEKTYPW